MNILHLRRAVGLSHRICEHFCKGNVITSKKNCVEKSFIHFASSRYTFRQFSWASWINFLSTSTPVLFFQDTLIQIHHYSGLPWWSVIMLSTIGLRSCITLPLAVHQYQVIGRLENVRKEMAVAAKQINKDMYDDARKYNWNFRTAMSSYNRRMRSKYKEIITRDNCHPMKLGVLVLVQVPIWICFSAALRNMCYMRPPGHDSLEIFLQLQSEGALWFSNLTSPDTVIIPLILGCLNLTIVEMYSLRNISHKTKFQVVLQNISRGFSIFIAIVASYTPSGVSFYWICSSSFGLVQNLSLLIPKVRHTLRIPKLSSDSEKPFSDMWNNLKSMLKAKKN